MKLLLLALITGFLTGFIFALLKLPIPAPGALPGIIGIVGIYAGFKVYVSLEPWISNLFSKN
ncbi:MULTISPECIES: XapX domain-containing protein [Bacillaceae]|uniref:XapX domain-containing protein n=1 Tax=Bacillaceae TaxID=186817 RepID=UPI001E2B225B|nr:MULTISPECIES: XapX domain-containing protein [Bacillaceae]MCE4049720.1 XapX domain-containing protein [Bacillus sp. Au-Bac7]MCM3031890.1 XapX domain-containing protein [Niallia sp. MER 6]MDL0437431.1 XapX domain-containing protein [Niallia sp. SS-2023]UPO87487.1 XapX domain-containing protein [Niallia sp. Man26]